VAGFAAKVMNAPTTTFPSSSHHRCDLAGLKFDVPKPDVCVPVASECM
jgi:hypothetical protein